MPTATDARAGRRFIGVRVGDGDVRTALAASATSVCGELGASSYVCFHAVMDFVALLITFGVVGGSLLLGVMTRTLWLKEDVKSRWWAGPLFFMGGVGAFTTSYHPVVEPLWLHYVLIVAVPFAVGYIGLALVTRRNSTDAEDDVEASR